MFLYIFQFVFFWSLEVCFHLADRSQNGEKDAGESHHFAWYI